MIDIKPLMEKKLAKPKWAQLKWQKHKDYIQSREAKYKYQDSTNK